MNVGLWILQLVLAVLAVSGGSFKLFSFDQVSSQAFFSALPRSAWGALGALEVAGGILLLVPKFPAVPKALTRNSAAVLAAESLALTALYARFSTAFVGNNPMVWSLLMAVLALFITVGRRH